MGRMSPHHEGTLPLGKVLSGWGSPRHCHTKRPRSPGEPGFSTRGWGSGMPLGRSMGRACCVGGAEPARRPGGGVGVGALGQLVHPTGGMGMGMGMGGTLLQGPLPAGPRWAMPPRMLGGSWGPLRVHEARGVGPPPPSRWTGGTTTLLGLGPTMSLHRGCHWTGWVHVA